MKIGIYCRVSSESQSENTSLPKQIENGKKFCNDNDYQYHYAAPNSIKKCIGAFEIYVYARL